MSLIEDLKRLETQGLDAVAKAEDVAALESVRGALLGKRGSLTAILRGLGSLSSEERPAAGKVSNDVRVALEQALAARLTLLSGAEMERRIAAERTDVTLPGRRRAPGHEHLIEHVVREIVDIFVGIGYRVAEGPEVELDYYNFTALNTPPDHPARNASDTFYVEDLSGEQATVAGESDVLLRTQTSPVQVRVMESQRPPIYVLAPGRVYRRDVADPSHLPQFTQVEGIVVDRGITFGDLKGTLEHFCREIFGAKRAVRIQFSPEQLTS